jgi:enoyl-CoA hydratase/carnithine racemase
MSLVNCQIENHIATLTLNAPDQLNAMDVAMGREFNALLKTIKKNKDIRVVIVTGAGRAFSSGGNLDMIAAKFKKSRAINQKELTAFYKLFLEVRNLPQPVIAAINGPAVGAGFCLALASDLRYVSATAKMGANFSRIGLAPGMGGTYLITRLAGPIFAAEILLTGKIFDAEEAQRFGLVNGVCAHDDLLTKVRSVAAEIAGNGPIPVQQIKHGIQMAGHKTLEQMFAYDAKMQAVCFASKDIQEGIQAVRDKRAPAFLGK